MSQIEVLGEFEEQAAADFFVKRQNQSLKAEIDEVPLVSTRKDPWPRALPEDAYHGVAGEFVRAMEPITEADNAAVLIQFLVGFGNMIGRSAHVMIGAGRHHTNLFAALVGNSGVGRKGTAWELVKLVLSRVDTQWWSDCRIFSLGSGEGLVAQVKDPDILSPEEMAKEKPRFETPKDKRGMVIEGEFGQVLKVFQREGGTLSPQIRNAWDSGDLRVTTKKDSLKATDAHISIIGHITSVELKQLFGTSDIFNGVGNRFLWVCTKRSKIIPRPKMPAPSTIDHLVETVSAAAKSARTTGEVSLSEAAERAYCDVYADITRDKPGVLGALTTRGSAMIQRLALIYALLDRSKVIELSHLRAAIGVWEYAEQSAAAVFGRQTGNRIADRLMEAIEESPDGLSQTEMLEDVFKRNVKKSDLAKALTLLNSYGLINATKERSAVSNRTIVRWRALTSDEFNEVPAAKDSQNSSNSYLVSQKQSGGCDVPA